MSQEVSACRETFPDRFFVLPAARNEASSTPPETAFWVAGTTAYIEEVPAMMAASCGYRSQYSEPSLTDDAEKVADVPSPSDDKVTEGADREPSWM